MTLDEAIEHAKEVARTCDDSQCAADHMQLAEWLRQARGAEKSAKWYTAKIQELETQLMDWKVEWESERDHADMMESIAVKRSKENAKLREFVSRFADAIRDYGCDNCPYDLECDTEVTPMRDGCLLYEEMRGMGIENIE